MRTVERRRSRRHRPDRTVDLRRARPFGLRSERRRRALLAAGLALMSCPVFVAGLWATGEYGEPWYGFWGVVAAISLLRISASVGEGRLRQGRWSP